MLLIRSAEELLESFRPLDLRLFELPDVDRYPFVVRGYKAWIESGGHRVYLVYEDGKRAQGILFTRSHGGPSASARMCDFCFSHGGGDEIGLLTADHSHRKKVGVLVCLDLRCGERLEEQCDRMGRDTVKERQKLVGRIARFAHEALGIEAPGSP